MHKAVFLDRDGVLNRERGKHTWRRADFEVLPGVAETLKLLQEAGWLLVVITNQSGIGLGLYDHADVEHVHGYLHRMLADHGVQLTAIYICPHHPSGGKCLCRKPGSLMLERALARHSIDASASVMIGDKERDILSAERVGVRGLLVKSNAPLRPVVMKEVLKG